MVAVVIYGVSMMYSVFLWRRGFRNDNRISYVLLLGAFCFHTSAMLLRGYRLNHCPVSNLYEATIFSTWTIVAIYMVVGLWSRLRFLGAFASPVLFCIGVFALMPGLDAPSGTRPEVPAAWTSAHAALLSLAYGAFGLSSIAAVMYLTQERNLKFHKLQAVFSLMPSIQRLEAVTGRMMVTGFLLLTAGLSIGYLGLTQLENARAFRTDPKVLWSALVWAIYFTLIILHWKFAQSGRRFALGAVGSFVFVLLTFWGTNALSPLHNP